ncbi:hypothetical protein FQN60_005998 [Etheostoma spectabile]|uniref:PDZ domain-containing protein n=1 Tax=Etheostoma spectabile TaxID=54343 RepID=A0A5J5CHS1_9PERO|nr:hypothetical protein FQN60_005998 [Etheostoma spectabile]
MNPPRSLAIRPFAESLTSRQLTAYGNNIVLVSPVSDYVIEEKTAVLQKRESEGFGFVLRGAKAETPIEEFAPTPAFPALQYLESVDQGGVNGADVVKVGHRQVVSLIRQGGSRLLMKVVSVSRKSESNLIRKKAPPPPKRAPSTSLTLRSKSMTADLEDIARRRRFEKLDEMLAGGQQEVVLRARPSDDFRAATVKQRPTSRRITQAEINSLFERQGLVPPSAPEKSTMALPRGMSRTKSFGTPDDDRISALINESRFPRSSSLTDSFIPPPPQMAPPPPPSASSSTSSLFLLDSGPPPSFLPPPPPARGEGLTRSSFKPGAEPRLQELCDSPTRSHAHAERQRKARSMIILQDTPPPPQPDAHAAAAATHSMHTATHTATHTSHRHAHVHAVPPRHQPRPRPLTAVSPPGTANRKPLRQRGTAGSALQAAEEEPQPGGAVPAAGSLGARPGPGSQVLSLPVCGGRRVREPGAPPHSEPFDGRPRRAAPPGAGPVALADASHLPPPADGETSRPLVSTRPGSRCTRTSAHRPHAQPRASTETRVRLQHAHPHPGRQPRGTTQAHPYPHAAGQPRASVQTPHPADKPRAANQAHHSPDQPRAEAQTHNPANIPRRASGAPGDRGRSDVPRRPLPRALETQPLAGAGQ